MVAATALSAARYGIQSDSIGELLLLCILVVDGTADGEVVSVEEIERAASTGAEVSVTEAADVASGLAAEAVDSKVIDGSGVSMTDGVASPASSGVDVAEGNGTVTLMYLHPHRHQRLSHLIGADSLRMTIRASAC